MKSINGIVERKLTAMASEAIRKQSPEELIRRTGARVTRHRVQVITLLQNANEAMSHLDVFDSLSKEQDADRVTIYRVLDWLVSEGIAHRLASQDRIWRFVLNDGGTNAVHHQHAHFVCGHCGKTVCLEDAPKNFRPKLPAGFEFETVEVNVKGRCSTCINAGSGSKTIGQAV